MEKNANALANHVLKTIKIRLRLELDNWVAVQLDRASTNKAVISRLKDSDIRIRPTSNYCCSHGLNNVGEKLLKAVNTLSCLENNTKVLYSTTEKREIMQDYCLIIQLLLPME